MLSRQGSVLVADATGSGKTRLGTHLIRAVRDQILRKGRIRQGKALMVCPPAVRDNWEWESHLCGVALDTYSHGSLSHARSGRHELTVEGLRRAQILCVDEGHNFLNMKSNRTQQLLRNMADHVLLFTATPINRSVVDLLRIADMLGADNLEPSTLDAFKKMLGVRSINRSLSEEEIGVLRREIQRFTVRRTKRMLNAQIDRDPEHYLDRDGTPCRFPRHLPKIYALDEPEADRQLAARIRELADQLYAVSHFVKPVEMPEVLVRQGWSEETYLNGRLASSRKIARYVIMASLRSSRAALAEHIVGTRTATRAFGLQGFSKDETGNQLHRLRELGGKLPRNKLFIPLPDWLSDPGFHRAACRLTWRSTNKSMPSEQHERCAGRTKARQLAELANRHALLLAFDSRPLTLAMIQRHLKDLQPAIRTLVAPAIRPGRRTSCSPLNRARLSRASSGCVRTAWPRA